MSIKPPDVASQYSSVCDNQGKIIMSVFAPVANKVHLALNATVAPRFLKTIAGVLILWWAASAGAVSYTVTDIGSLGGTYSAPYGINNNGQVVGVANLPDYYDHGFIYTAGSGMQDIGTMSGLQSWARAINNSGQVVGEASITGSIYNHAFLYTPGIGIQDIGTLGGISSIALSINASGQVVGYSDTVDGYIHAFLYTQGSGMQDIGTLGGVGTGHHYSIATSINDNGQIVGYGDTDLGNEHAFLYTPGGVMQDIGTLGGGSSRANSINSSGQVVGTSSIVGDSYDSIFKYTPNIGMENIGSLGGVYIEPSAINSSGEVVGYTADAYGAEHAFLYTSGGGIQDLSGLVGGGRFSYALGINDSGKIIIQAPGNPHGLLLTPTGLLPPQKNQYNGNPKDAGDCHCLGQGNPINAGTGNKVQEETDYVGAGAFPLKLVRVYNSRITNDGYFGVGWRTTYDNYRVSKTSATLANVTRPDGKQYVYKLINGVWTGDADVTDKLVQLVDGTGATAGWTYTLDTGESEHYDATGLLASLTNSTGLTQTLTRTTDTIVITDAFGRQMTFAQNSAGDFTATVPGGDVYTYHEDANKNLATVTYPDGKVRTYVYGEAANVSATPAAGVSYTHALTGIIDENGNRFATWRYDAAGNAYTSEHGIGVEKVTLTFNAGNTVITDALGTSRTQTMQVIQGAVKGGATSQPSGSGSAASSNNIIYDVNGNIASRTDFNGNTTCYAYDLTRNLETVRVEGLALGVACPTNLATYVPSTAVGSAERKITTQWHPTLRLPVAIAEPLRFTNFVYNNDTIAGSAVTCGYQADGVTPVPNVLCRTTLQATTDKTGALGFSAVSTGIPRIRNFTYSSSAQVLTEDGPRIDVTDLTTYTYDTQGNLATVTNALNQLTTLGGYNAHGQPGLITDANGVVTELLYDARQRLTTRTVGVGSAAPEVTAYVYDGVGQLTQVTLPDTSFVQYTYDVAHRLTDIADNLANHIHYTLDLMGNRTHEDVYDPNNVLARTRSRIYDPLNRLQQETSAHTSLTYQYDPQGNLTYLVDALSRSTHYNYDALNRMTATTDAATGQTHYSLNALDQLTQVVTPNSATTQYQRDGLNNLNAQISPDTGTTGYVYDEAGNILVSTDALGQTTAHSYDALNRITQTLYAASNTAPFVQIDYQYDTGNNGIGKLTHITEAENNLVVSDTAYSYDLLGHITAEVDTLNGVAYTTGYRYSNAGHLIGVDYPSGRSLDYTLDSVGRIQQINTTKAAATSIIVSNITYQTFGNSVTGYTLGNGRVVTRQLDLDGAVSSYTLNGASQTLTYDSVGRIATRTNTASPLYDNSSYSYDALDRLTDAVMPNITQNYSYDANGNRLTASAGVATDIYAYTTGSNRLNSITRNNTNAVRNFTLNANGSTTADGTVHYNYDLRGRKSLAWTNGGNTSQYRFNALGQRILKTTTGVGTTLYHYDKDGKLIGESDTTGMTKREYIYLDGTPIAVWE